MNAVPAGSGPLVGLYPGCRSAGRCMHLLPSAEDPGSESDFDPRRQTGLHPDGESC